MPYNVLYTQGKLEVNEYKMAATWLHMEGERHKNMGTGDSYFSFNWQASTKAVFCLFAC